MKIATQKIQKVFSEAKVPVIFATDKDKVELHSFSDESGAMFISSEGDFFNPSTGEKVTKTKVETASATQTVDVSKYPVICSCEACNADIRASAEVAEELDGMDIACVACGSVTEVSYFGDLLEAMEDLEPVETPEEEEEDEEEPSDEEEDLSDFDFDSDEEEPSDEEEETEEEIEEEPSDDEVTAELEELANFDFDEADDLNVSEVNVDVASSKLDTTESFSFLARDEAMSKIEVFLGNTHLGSLIKEQATAESKLIYAKPASLKNAVTHLVLSHIADTKDEKIADDLKAVGFVPATITVDLPTVNQQTEVEKQVEIETEVAKQVDAKEVAFLASLEVAMTAVNKGLLKGNSPYVDLANVLKSRGVMDASSVSRKFVEESLSAFLKSSFAHAKDLSQKDPKFVLGFSQSVEVAAYGTIDVSNEMSLLNSSIVTPIRQTTLTSKVENKVNPKVEVASHLESPILPSNRFSGAFKRFGR
jgi:hypothetical protein